MNYVPVSSILELEPGFYWFKSPKGRKTIIQVDEGRWFEWLGIKGKDPLNDYKDWFIAPCKE